MKNIKRLFPYILFSFLFLLISCKNDVDNINEIVVVPDPPLPVDGNYTWKPLKVGAGGWVVGMFVHPSERNLFYVRTDVSGAYRWNPKTSEWKQIVLSTNMPSEYVSYATYGGVNSLVGAPSNPDIAYMALRKQIFKSEDRGNTWTATSFNSKNITMNNGEGRQEGERLSIDPNNSDVVYYGSINNGLWVTLDGGVNWSNVTTIPIGMSNHGVNTIVFDKESGTTEMKTNIIYVTVDNEGVFRSSNAGSTWERISDNGPGTNKRYRDAEIGSDRTYYVAFANDGGSAGGVWKYSFSGDWVNITPSGSQPYQDLAIDPNNEQRIIVARSGGTMWTSSNQGLSWLSRTFKRVSSSITWMGQQTDSWLSIGELQFDPFDSGKLWFAEGFGVWWTKDVDVSPIVWQEESKGIEETCGNDIVCPPGGKPITAMWDLGVFYHEDPDSYNAIRSQTVFRSGWAIDWCPADPNFIVAILQSHHGEASHASYSINGGKTWTKFSYIPDDLTYGVIAVSATDKNNIVWVPSNGKLPYYSKNRGGSWQQGYFSEITSSGFTSYTSPRKPLCADRVDASTFYFYHNEGVFRSIDGGSTWAKMANSPFAAHANIMMKTTPGHAKDLWIAEGKTNVISGGLWHSTDGGSTWMQKWDADSGLQQVFSFGFGKAKTVGGYPTIFAAGVSNGQHGIYRSDDSGTIWERIGTYPLGIFDYVDAIDGDKDVFGKVYVCFAGSGFACGTIK